MCVTFDEIVLLSRDFVFVIYIFLLTPTDARDVLEPPLILWAGIVCWMKIIGTYLGLE